MDFTKSSIIGEIVLETQYYTAKHAAVVYMNNQYSKGLHMKDFKEDLVNLSDKIDKDAKEPRRDFSWRISKRVELIQEDIKNIKRIVITALVVSSILTFALSIGVAVGMFTEYMWLVMFCASTTLFTVGALIDKINKELFGE